MPFILYGWIILNYMGSITFCLSIYELMDIGLFPLFGYYEHFCTSFCMNIFSFSGYIFRNSIPGPYGNSMFKFLRPAKVFHNGCPILYSHWQRMRVSNFLTSFQYVDFFFFIIAILVDMKRFWFRFPWLMLLSIFSWA